MHAAVRLPRLGLFDVFSLLIDSHPSALMGQRQERRLQREMEDRLAAMPPHLRDDLGLPPAPTEPPEHPAIARMRSLGRNWG